MNLLYIGAGTDFSILKVDLPIKIFFFVDSQPRSEYGNANHTAFERKGFIKIVKTELKKLGYVKFKRYVFGKINKGKNYYDDGVMIYRSKDYSKFLYYFYSTTFPPREGHPLLQFVEKCNVLFVKGHAPEANVVEIMYDPIIFIGSDDTVYKEEDKFFETKEKISKWYVQQSDTGELKEISSHEELLKKSV
jgi:hypothetical protein